MPSLWRSLTDRNGKKSPRSETPNTQSLNTRSPKLQTPKSTDSMPTNGDTTVARSPPEPAQLSKLDEVRENIGQSLGKMTTLLSAMRAPLPTQTGDGTALPAEQKTGILNDTKSILGDMSKLGFNTLEKVAEMGTRLKLGQDIDDREYLMEYMVQAAAKSGDSVLGKKLTTDFVTTLWNDLSHPPQVYLDDKHKYRQPDGSDNSWLHPKLGAAHQPYARTVKPSTVQPGNLPDAGVLFDTLLARKAPELHPNRISSVLFYVASIIIHDCFRTNHKDFRTSDTSSYLDLSPLYGSDWDEQKRMRTFKDGKIKPDCFSETRLLAFPPGVSALLLMFNRFHNYVVDNLASINENGQFTRPQDDNADKLNKLDEDLFQTGRLVTCGLYVNIILIDYVRTILNLNRTDENWQLNPRVDIPNGPEIGTGNQVSAEFNLVYRWHSSISDRDDKWTQELWKKIFKGKKPDDVGEIEMLKTLGHMQADNEKLEPNQRDYHGWKRQADGTLLDTDLVEALVSSIEDCSNAFGPQKVPTIMRAIEILGIKQARAWNLATLNEFRKHFALKPHREFSDITTNKEVAETLKHLYDTPDQVELYPGLVVEDSKDPKLPGSGLCPSYTTSRAVLSDAVALVRGDRFYTTSYHPKALTNWGFAEAAFDLTVDNGCVFYKLFLRAFPNSFDPQSVYVHYPMTIPSEMKTILTDLRKAKKYNFDRPSAVKADPGMVFSYNACKQILNDQESFKVTWGKGMEFLMGPGAKPFMLAGDTPTNYQSRDLMENAIYLGPYSRTIPKGNETWLLEVKKYYEEITTKLLKQKTYKLGKVNQVDIIRDIGNMAHVHFAAEMYSLPLKTEDFPLGVFTEKQMYLIMAAVFTCVFYDLDPEHSFPLRMQAYDVTQKLGQILIQEINIVKKTGKLTEYMKHFVAPDSKNPLKHYGLHMIERLIASGRDAENLVWGNILATAGGTVANQGQLIAQVFDYIFTTGQKYIPELNRLAKLDTPEADDTLLHYFMEFSRLQGETGVLRRCAKATTVQDYDRTLHFKPGDEVMVNFKAAGRDSSHFKDADNVDLTRPIDSYMHLGLGPHQCLGLPLARVSLTTMLKVICRLDNLRAAPVYPGPLSAVKKVLKPFGPNDTAPESWHYHAYLTEDWNMYFPFPTSLKVNFDGEIR
ncbi:hypothetical protein MBLNU459_g8005t1 [Dothideomycetes sp. NU459]